MTESTRSNHLRVGVLGTGHIGAVHLQSALAMPDVTVVAADAVESSRERALELGAEAVYDDYAELLARERVDVAVVALPPFLHLDAVRAAAEAGCDVFVEKPLGRTVAEAREILDIADAAGIAVGVDHTIRYQPEIRRLKAAYDEGVVGAVPLASITRINSGPFSPYPDDRRVGGWQLDPEATGGGALVDLGVHLVDVLEWFFGELEVKYAHLSNQLQLPYEDAAVVVLQSKDAGTVVTLNCGYFQWERPPTVNTSFRLEGTTGWLDSRDYLPKHFGAYAARSAMSNVARRIGGKPLDYYGPTYFYRAHYDALADFLDAIREGRTPPVDGHAGLRAMELVEAAYEAAGRRVQPQPEVAE